MNIDVSSVELRFSELKKSEWEHAEIKVLDDVDFRLKVELIGFGKFAAFKLWNNGYLDVEVLDEKGDDSDHVLRTFVGVVNEPDLVAVWDAWISLIEHVPIDLDRVALRSAKILPYAGQDFCS